MKIAVTSQNFRTITGHAGKTRRFLVFENNQSGALAQTDRIDLPKEMSIHAHARGAPHPLDEMDVVVTAGCGEGFRKKMAERDVIVMTTSESDPAAAAAAVMADKPLAPAASHEH